MRKFLGAPAYAISLQNLFEFIWCIRTIFTGGAGKGAGLLGGHMVLGHMGGRLSLYL